MSVDVQDRLLDLVDRIEQTEIKIRCAKTEIRVRKALRDFKPQPADHGDRVDESGGEEGAEEDLEKIRIELSRARLSHRCLASTVKTEMKAQVLEDILRLDPNETSAYLDADGLAYFKALTEETADLASEIAELDEKRVHLASVLVQAGVERRQQLEKFASNSSGGTSSSRADRADPVMIQRFRQMRQIVNRLILQIPPSALDSIEDCPDLRQKCMKSLME